MSIFGVPTLPNADEGYENGTTEPAHVPADANEGDLIVVFLSVNNPDATDLSVYDTSGNSYTILGGPNYTFQVEDLTYSIRIAYARANATGLISYVYGTWNDNGGPAYVRFMCVFVIPISGGTPVLDTMIAPNYTGSTPTKTSEFNTTGDDEIVLLGVFDADHNFGSWTVDSPYTIPSANPGFYGTMAYNTYSSPQSGLQVEFDDEDSTNVVYGIAFKAATPGVGLPLVNVNYF